MAAELANGRLFEAMAKYIPYYSDAHGLSQQSPSPMLWGIPEVIQERLGNSVKNIHFERGAVNKPVLSANDFGGRCPGTKSGSLIECYPTARDAQKVESLRNDVLQAITPYIQDDVLRQTI